jgi:glycosyltransferase EpsJ
MLDLYRHWNIDDPHSREMIARRYVERLVGCIENVTNKSCKLPHSEKRKKIKQMLNGEHVVPCLKQAKPRSLMMKILLIPIRMRNVTLTMAQGKVISLVKSTNIKLFATLKANR